MRSIAFIALAFTLTTQTLLANDDSPLKDQFQAYQKSTLASEDSAAIQEIKSGKWAFCFFLNMKTRSLMIDGRQDRLKDSDELEELIRVLFDYYRAGYLIRLKFSDQDKKSFRYKSSRQKKLFSRGKGKEKMRCSRLKDRDGYSCHAKGGFFSSEKNSFILEGKLTKDWQQKDGKAYFAVGEGKAIIVENTVKSSDERLPKSLVDEKLRVDSVYYCPYIVNQEEYDEVKKVLKDIGSRIWGSFRGFLN